MALLKPLYQIASICAYHGVEHAVICPGSRSAALTLAFARNGSIATQVIVDERSAAFVALGKAQISQRPVVLICTSGTASLNFASAVAEAFFQKIPLLILTADRPPEWIHQHDGQTIFQSNIYGKHVLKSYDLPVDYSHADSQWQIERTVYEALHYAAQGPVHINVPIREPFYPNEDEVYEENFRKLHLYSGESILSEWIWEKLLEEWGEAQDIIIAVGQNHTYLDNHLAQLVQDRRVTLWTDVISNVHIEDKVSCQDTFLPHYKGKGPDLLITLGQSFISKAFKLWVRKNKPGAHWHIDASAELIDPLQSITHKLEVSSDYFLRELTHRVVVEYGEKEQAVVLANQKAQAYLQKALSKLPFGELKFIYRLLQHIPEHDMLHLGNSMPVRYANILGGFLKSSVKVFANRGTSGIDGIVSTAIGQALMTHHNVHCVVGDVSFFYDSNALFAAQPKNLRVYLVNNGGGNIFRIIEGPRKQGELESHFITNPQRKAESICKEAGVNYKAIYTEADLEQALNYKEDVAALFEIFVDGKNDFALFQELKKDFYFTNDTP